MRGFLRSLHGVRLLAAVGVALALLVGAARLSAMVYTEVLWQAGAGYLDVFLRRVAWQWGVRLLAGLVVAVAVYFNLKVVAGTLGGIQIKRRFGNLEISEQLPQSYVFWTLVGTSALLALWFGAAVPASVGIQLLLAIQGGAWGVVEPILGRDLGFYVFWIPVMGSAVTFLLVMTFLLFTLSAGGYAATGALRWGGGRIVAQELARTHLGALLGVFFLLIAARVWLSGYLLLLDGSSDVQGIFGFTDAQARLPALQTLTVLCAGAGVAMFWGARTNRGRVLVGAAAGTVAATLLIGQFYPAMVQRFQVEPNELDRETPYIRHNLAFTRSGFGLDELERRDFTYRYTDSLDWADGMRQFAGLPVWSRPALLTTFREVEARFPYYDFADVAIDRYATPRGDVPVALSVRELDPGGIQDPNWQNLHLRERYVRGLGAVASLASRATPQGRPAMIVSGIPPEFVGGPDAPADLRLTRPEVFFGSRPQVHAVVNPSSGQFTAPDGGAGEVGVDFPDGIRLGSMLRKVSLAWRFRDANLLFAGEVGEESRFVFRRQIGERVRAIVPFLRTPEAPYPVVADGRIVWVLEAFTATRAYPLSTARELQALRTVSYVRNSVKITVDAISGRVDFYRVPVEDPLADAYGRAFPGLFRPIEEMPAEVRAHIRYPRTLLDLQAEALLQYHQETAAAFHGQQDVWSRPTELSESTTPAAYRPEYGIWQLPGETEPRFQLSTVFVPTGRQNLTGILVGRVDPSGVPELVLLNVPVADQAPGPRQIEALIEQDPVISQQFSLWRTGGSEVWTGHLHVVPVGRRLLYMEPVFLAADADAIPELRRYVVSDGRRVAMAERLAGAVSLLAGEDAGMAVPTQARPEGDTAGWPRAALDLLDRAERSLRAGDWEGFGAALSELRALLQQLGGTSSGSGR